MSNILDAIPSQLAHRFEVLPVGKFGGKLMLAMEDPENLSKLDELGRLLRREIIPIRAPRVKLLDAINRRYGLGADVLDQLIL